MRDGELTYPQQVEMMGHLNAWKARALAAEALLNAARAEARPAPVVEEACKLCEGNGEIVTDWDVYLHPPEGAEADAGTATCPDCDGSGRVEVARPAVDREAVALLACRFMNDSGLDWPEASCRDQLTYIDKPHDGDCTKKPYTCLRCCAEDAYRFADAILALLSPATSPEEGQGQRCATCRHFCLTVSDFGSCARWAQGYGTDVSELKSNEVLVENDEGWAMVVGRDFGCVLHSPAAAAPSLDDAGGGG